MSDKDASAASPSESRSALVMELAEEFLKRYRKGERPSLKEYADRHPEFAVEIREVFPAMAMMEKIALADASVEDERISTVSRTSEISLKQLGDYRIIREIGHGGMGVVYEAEQVSLGRHVALKVLPNQALADAKQKRRFEREAKAAAKLHHTNIVPVFGVGEHDGLPYYVMQFIQGLGLDVVLEELNHMQPGGAHTPTGLPAAGEIRVARRDTVAADVARSLLIGTFQPSADSEVGAEVPENLAQGATEELPAAESTVRSVVSAPAKASGLSESFTVSSSSIILPGSGTSAGPKKSGSKKQSYWHSVADIGRQVADALDYAHKQGILHRDVKPSNLLLDLRGTVWVTDFGLAKVVGPGADNLTHTGDILGTLRYMPPEAFEGKSDARSDLYSLGLTMYELLAMRPAFEEKDRAKLIKLVTTGEPAPLHKIKREAPRDLVTIIHKAIDRDPGRRYATAGDMASDLQRFLDDEPIQARRQTPLERYWRWARHNPGIAVLGGVLTAVLVLATVTSLIVAGHMSTLATNEAKSADDERMARREAEEAKNREAQEKLAAEAAKQDADESRKRADREAAVARQNLYYAQMHLAQQAWREHRGLHHQRALLTNWLPEGESPDRRGWEWFYLNSLPYQSLRTLTERDSGFVEFVRESPRTVAWHIASKRLAEGSFDGLIRIWDVEREQTIVTLKGPPPVQPMMGAAWFGWSPDGAQLAGGCRDGTVHVWETASGRELHVLRGHKSPVWSVAFDRGGTHLASWAEDGSVKIWDADTGQLTAEVVHPGGVRAGAWSPDDKLLASGHGDGTVTVSGTDPGDKIVTLEGHVRGIIRLVWSPDGTRLASASEDFTARIWSVAKGEMVLGPLRHSHEISSLAWEPDGKRLATGSADETVKIWSATTGREIVTLRGHYQSITSLSWGPGGCLASGCRDGSVRIWNSIHDQESNVLPGHDIGVRTVSWSPDGKRLASGSYDGTVRIWDSVSREEVLTLKGHDERRVTRDDGLQCRLAWSPDSTHIVAGLDDTAKVWEVATGREVYAFPAGHGRVCSVGWSHDGKHLAVGSADGSIRVIEALKQAPTLHVFKAHPGGYVRCLAWSPQGDRLASGGWGDALVKLWDPLRGIELTRMKGHQYPLVLGVAWSPDGKRLASVAGDRLVMVWDAETGRKVWTMRGHNDFVDGVAWSPDGKRLASAGYDNTVRIWDPRTGEEAFALRGNSGMFHYVSWHPDGAQLTAASSDGQIRIWDATRGFERDRTPRALPYIERALASGTARGEDLLGYAQSYFGAGRPTEAMALINDNPSAALKLYLRLTSQERKVFTQLRPGAAADWLRAGPQQPALEPTAIDEARALMRCGVGSFQRGRLAEAIRNLETASDLLRFLLKPTPNDGRLASDLGIAVGILGSALRDSQRPVEALAAIQEQRSVLESMQNPASQDLYNLACCYAQLSVLFQHAATSPTAAEREALATQAVDTLRRSIAAGMKNFALMERDHDLDSLRQRPDFRALIESAGRARDKADNDKK
jgi:WD40 repeat protein/serine/threonine protein kinase